MKRSLIKVLEHCHRIGALIYIEWPKTCAYWQDPDIVSWIARFKLSFAEFHGCQYGLHSVIPERSHKFINKPWYGVTNSQFICGNITRKCQGEIKGVHEHVACQGPDTLPSQNYTIQLVSKFHDLFRRRAYTILREKCQHRKVLKGAVCAQNTNKECGSMYDKDFKHVHVESRSTMLNEQRARA